MLWFPVLMLLAADPVVPVRVESAGLARITVIAPKDGKDAEFEAGYRRHLDWHRAHGDPWTWYGWTLMTGERSGLFIDGTFGHGAEELDAPVAPAEDRADNEKNVEPHATFVSTAFYRLRPDLSRGTHALLESPYAVLATVQVRSGKEKDFEVALVRHRSTDARLVFELVNGGEVPSYLVFVPGEKVSQLLQRPAVPSSDAIARARTEALRFRRDLTYAPAK